MKYLSFLFVFCLLLIVSPVFALFCEKCGQKLANEPKFCSSCGAKIQPATSSDLKPMQKETPKPPATATTGSFSNEVFRAKTDLYLYERRGDERNVLKKNLFFKPRRYKLQRNEQFRILEEVGGSLLVKSISEKGGKTFQGWVTNEELALRSEWKKK